jgi:hypothetical protein
MNLYLHSNVCCDYSLKCLVKNWDLSRCWFLFICFSFFWETVPWAAAGWNVQQISVKSVWSIVSFISEIDFFVCKTYLLVKIEYWSHHYYYVWVNLCL